MYEIEKLCREDYSSYYVRTKVLTKFNCELDLWHKNLKAFFPNFWTYHQTGLYYQFWPYYQISRGFHRTLQRVRLANRGRLLLRTPGPVLFGTCICSNVETILYWTCHIYEPFEFRTSLGTSILLFPFHHPASKYRKRAIENSNYSLTSNRVGTKVLTKVRLWPWPLNPKMYRYLSLNILHLCKNYESCTLKTTQVIVSKPTCWQI